MLIIGSGGCAKDLISNLSNKHKKRLAFYDDVNAEGPEVLYGKYPILKTTEEAVNYFKETDIFFTVGVGGPANRSMLSNKFIELGGNLKTIVHKYTTIGEFQTKIDEGCIISHGVGISNSVDIGKGVLINANAIVGHDTSIGQYSELCPSVNILGHCKIGDEVFIGTGAIVLPHVKIGNGAIISAGAIVRQDVPPNTLVLVNPAREIRRKVTNTSKTD
jgi:sugar O-acyltransferase (sialic acid O-acetyltransferase NeuD family)